MGNSEWVCRFIGIFSKAPHKRIWQYTAEGSCETVGHCSRCGDEISLTRHEWGEIKEEPPCNFSRTCSLCGKQEEWVEHYWQRDIDHSGFGHAAQVCQHCGDCQWE